MTEFYDSYPEFLAELAPAAAQRKLHHRTHIVEGLESIPVAFPRMFTGLTTGKMVAKIN